MYRTQRGKVPYRHRRSLIVLSCFLLVGWPRTRPNLLYPLGSIQESHDKKLFRNYLGLILTEGRLNAERSLMDFSNATPFSRPRRCATLASIFSHICKKKVSVLMYSGMNPRVILHLWPLGLDNMLGCFMLGQFSVEYALEGIPLYH